MSREIKGTISYVSHGSKPYPPVIQIDVTAEDAETVIGLSGPVTLVVPEATSAFEGGSTPGPAPILTLADLSGRDIGKRIRIEDQGTVWENELMSIDHHSTRDEYGTLMCRVWSPELTVITRAMSTPFTYVGEA